MNTLSRKRSLGHTVLPQADRKATWPDQQQPYGCSEHCKQAWAQSHSDVLRQLSDCLCQLRSIKWVI